MRTIHCKGGWPPRTARGAVWITIAGLVADLDLGRQEYRSGADTFSRHGASTFQRGIELAGWQPMSVSSFPEGQRICVIPLAQTLTLTAIARRLPFVPSEASRLQVRPAVVVVVTDRSPLNPSVA